MTSPNTPPPADPAAPAQGPLPAGQAGWQPGWQPGWHEHHRDERRGAIIGGLVLVLLGLAFLVQEFVPNVDIGRFWPLILIVIGAALLLSSVRRRA